MSPSKARAPVIPGLIAEHRDSLLILGLYAAASYVWLRAYGRGWYPLSSLPMLALPWLLFSFLYMSLQLFRYPRGNPDAPSVPNRVVNGLVFGTMVALMSGCFHSIKHSIAQVRGLGWDPALSRIDIALHGGHAPGVWLLPYFSDRGIYVMDRLYGAWGVVALAFTVWLAWTVHPLRHQARMAWFFLWIGAGSVAAWALASGGPIVLDPRWGAGDYTALFDRLRSIPGLPTPDLQAALVTTSREDRFVPFAGISAMPSLHVGGVVLLTLAGWARSQVLGLVFLTYAVVIVAGSALLGWHYLIDGYVGGVMAWLAWKSAGWIAAAR